MITLIPFMRPDSALVFEPDTARALIYGMDITPLQKRQCVLIHARTARIFTTLCHANETLPDGETFHLFFRDIPYLLLMHSTNKMEWWVYDVLGSLVMTDLSEVIRQHPALLTDPHLRVASHMNSDQTTMEIDQNSIPLIQWNYHPYIFSEIKHLLLDLSAVIDDERGLLTFSEFFDIFYTLLSCNHMCTSRETVKWLIQAALFEFSVNEEEPKSPSEWGDELRRLIPLFDRNG